MNKIIKKQLQARLAKLETAIDIAETAIADMTAGGISSFELDTGEANQKVIFRNVNTFTKYLDAMYAKQEWLVRRLTGGAIVSVRARRKP